MCHLAALAARRLTSGVAPLVFSTSWLPLLRGRILGNCMAGFSVKSLRSKTHHPKKTRHPKTLRASSPFLIQALTFPVPSVSFLPYLSPQTSTLARNLGCLLPVPHHTCTGGGNLVSHVLVPSCPLAAYSTGSGQQELQGLFL